MKDVLDIFLNTLDTVKLKEESEESHIASQISMKSSNLSTPADDFHIKSIDKMFQDENDDLSKKNDKIKDKNDVCLNHRDRVKSRFLEMDKNIFQDYEIMEMILFFLIPRSDVKPLAKEIMQYFKSFDNLFRASEFEIEKFISNTKNFRFFLNLISEVNIRKLKSDIKNNDIFLKKDNFIEFCKEISFFNTEDRVHLILLDKNKMIIGYFDFLCDNLKDENLLLRSLFEIILQKKNLKNIFFFKKVVQDDQVIFNINNFLEKEVIFLTKLANISNKFDIDIISNV